MPGYNEHFEAGKISPADLSFEFTRGEQYRSHHRIVATMGGQYVGHIEWHPKSGRVMGVEVAPEHRRKGIATHLWRAAIRQAADSRSVKKPIHSSDRTDAGDAWARAIGGTLPRRNDV